MVTEHEFTIRTQEITPLDGIFTPAALTALADDVYTSISTPQRRVTADSKFCTLVNDRAAHSLRGKGIKVDYLEYEKERGMAAHAFLRLPRIVTTRGISTWLLDLQFQQFIPVAERSDLLPTLAIKYTNPIDVIRGLTAHKIPERLHDYWLSELFYDQPNLLHKTLYPYR